MKATLEHLVHCCQGNDRPECPILAELAGDTSEGAPRATPKRSASLAARRRSAPRG
jgi:MerR family transcriptional regulator, copper efflux regulator